MDRVKYAIVTCGYLGASPVAPGTAGTLGAVPIAWLLGRTQPFLLWTLVAVAFLYVIGRSLGDWSERYAGKKDPGIFVLDEVAGYLVTIAWITGPSLLTLTVGFFVFRAFDILKPPPGRRLENLGGGDGIMLDDIAAGLYGLAVMAVLRTTLLAPENWTV